MASIFSKIVSGEIPGYKVHEDSEFLAFLDINPVRKGHTLVVPKVEIDYLFDLSDDLLSRMIVFAKKVAKGLEAAIPCERIGMTVIGLEVPHAHIHLIPINGLQDMNFSQAKLSLPADEMVTIQNKIQTALYLIFNTQ